MKPVTLRAAIVALALVAAIVLAVACVRLGDHNARPQLLDARAHDRGRAGVAAAYGYPLMCLSVTVPAGERTYARADFNHRRRCGQYTGDPTAIFHYAHGAWRPALDAVAYQCPVSAIPAAVQTELDVCP